MGYIALAISIGLLLHVARRVRRGEIANRWGLPPTYRDTEPGIFWFYIFCGIAVATSFGFIGVYLIQHRLFWW